MNQINLTNNLQSAQQFGVSEAEREVLHKRWRKAVVRLGERHPNTVMDLARLCVGYGMTLQPYATSEDLYEALNHLRAVVNKVDSVDLVRVALLVQSALAFSLAVRDRVNDSSPVVLANMAYLGLVKCGNTDCADLVSAAHVGAFCWWSVCHKVNARAALKAAEMHLKDLSRETHPKLFKRHDSLKQIVETMGVDCS